MTPKRSISSIAPLFSAALVSLAFASTAVASSGSQHSSRSSSSCQVTGTKHGKAVTINVPCTEQPKVGKGTPPICHEKGRLHGKTVHIVTSCSAKPTPKTSGSGSSGSSGVTGNSKIFCADQSTALVDPTTGLVNCANDDAPTCTHHGFLTTTSAGTPICLATSNETSPTEPRCQVPSSTAVGAATQQIVCLNGSNIHCPYHGVLGTDANDNPYCYPDGTDPAATAPNVDLSASELGVCDDGSTPGALGYDNTGTLLCADDTNPSTDNGSSDGSGTPNAICDDSTFPVDGACDDGTVPISTVGVTATCDDGSTPVDGTCADGTTPQAAVCDDGSAPGSGEPAADSDGTLLCSDGTYPIDIPSGDDS